LLYETVLDVDATGEADPRYSVAAVFALVEAPDEAAALELLRGDLARSGHRVLSTGHRVTPIPAADWGRYIQQNWPARANEWPSADHLVAVMRSSPVVHLSFYPHD
jgi:hypothetical protein